MSKLGVQGGMMRVECKMNDKLTLTTIPSSTNRTKSGVCILRYTFQWTVRNQAWMTGLQERDTSPPISIYWCDGFSCLHLSSDSKVVWSVLSRRDKLLFKSAPNSYDFPLQTKLQRCWGLSFRVGMDVNVHAAHDQSKIYHLTISELVDHSNNQSFQLIHPKAIQPRVIQHKHSQALIRCT